jgi:hypothetical protein
MTEVKLDLVHIDTGDRSTRSNQPGHLERDGTSTAAEIDATHSRGQARPRGQGRGVGPPVASQQQEAFVTLLATADHVPVHPHDSRQP